MDELTIHHFPDLGDWYVIGCENWRRFGNASVEGDTIDMRELAAAIRNRERFSAKRCAVAVDGDRVELWSPRNSTGTDSVTLAEADQLAANIGRVLAKVTT